MAVMGKIECTRLPVRVEMVHLIRKFVDAMMGELTVPDRLFGDLNWSRCHLRRLAWEIIARGG